MRSNKNIYDPCERYKLVNKIGRGAYADVYKVWDELDEKYVGK
jgi:hypothetical protein